MIALVEGELGVELRVHVCESIRWTAPAPTSNDGTGNQMPLRTKNPTVDSDDDVPLSRACQ